ncbi:DUF3471 domain-containing protein [Granulicella aggregans]|jgi:hypothetical protein|uniref:DUF3471 domain-containing protein n=1 Tax=Granulicella aggregans TaxID=474949 RepID=UPI0021E0EED8|nr:hypothetical protein [Granulicella aggregans]
MNYPLQALTCLALTLPVALSAQSPSSSFVAATSADEAAIRAIVASQSASQEDPHVASDLDWENAFGVRFTNLKKRNDWFNTYIKSPFKDATDETLEVKIRLLEPTVAVADEYWHIAGQVYAGETKPGADRWGRTTYIFKKENGIWTEVMERVADLRGAYFKHYDTLPAAVPLPAATLASYAGTYEIAPGRTFTIEVAGDHLSVTSRGQTYTAIPTSPTEFLGFRGDNAASYQKLSFTTTPGTMPKVAMSYADGTPIATATKVK